MVHKNLTQATLPHPLYETFYGHVIVIVTMTKHGPVDATDDVFHSTSPLAGVEVNVLQNDGKYVLLVTAGRVQFIGAKFGIEVLGRDDRYQRFALL